MDNQKNELVNSKLLIGVPSFPDPSHIGGIIRIGPDENLYFTVGNFQNTIPSKIYKTKTQNLEDGEPVDGRAGILRMSQGGTLVENDDGSYDGILGETYPLNMYYAYGIRNSFGLDFDPLTGKLWDTENGPKYGDEINLAEPGFNSGSDKIFGIFESSSYLNIIFRLLRLNLRLIRLFRIIHLYSLILYFSAQTNNRLFYIVAVSGIAINGGAIGLFLVEGNAPNTKVLYLHR